MIQEFLVISPRGDTLIAKSYAGTVNRSTADTFLRRVKSKSSGGGAQPPLFQFDGITYCHVQTNSMYFVVTTHKNCQAATLIELLQRLSRVFKVPTSSLFSPPAATANVLASRFLSPSSSAGLSGRPHRRECAS